MADSGKTTGGEGDKASPTSGVSQFLARVLEQLSLSSWMPAAMLVGNTAVLVVLHSVGGVNIAKAFGVLAADPWADLVIFLIALIPATVLIQAFEFESIRVVEGYLNHGRGPLLWLAKRRIRRHVKKRAKFARVYQVMEREQFSRARMAMLSLPVPIDQEILNVLERDLYGKPQPADLNDEWLEGARSFDWTQYVPAEDLFLIDAIDSKVARYPAPHRVLPTRLGNALRAAEDNLTIADDENLEGYVLRNHQDLPDLLKNEHHDYRTRLEMYAGLMVVFLILALGASAALTATAEAWKVCVVVLGYLSLCCISYEACIASALGYGDVLREIDRVVASDYVTDSASV